MSNNSIAAGTIFSGFGTDDVLGVDVYKQDTSAPQNSVWDAAKKAAGDTANAIRKRPGLLSDLASIAISAKTGGDKASMTARLAGILGQGGAGPLGELSSSVQNTMFAGLGLSPETAKGVKLAIGEAVTLTSSGNLTDAQGLASVVSRITGNSELFKAFDLEAQAAMFSAIFNEAINLGVPSMLDMLKEYASDPSVWENAYVASAPQAMLNGDLDTLAKIISEVGANAVLGETPDAINLIISNYKFGRGITPDMHPAILAKMIAVLVSLNPYWDTYLRAGVRVINFGVFTTASEDSITLFKTSDFYRPTILVAPNYPAFDLVELAKVDYPGASIGVISAA